MKSPLIDKILKDMSNDPWYIRLRRWFSIQIWVYRCFIRWYYREIKYRIIKHLHIWYYVFDKDKYRCDKCHKLITNKEYERYK